MFSFSSKTGDNLCMELIKNNNEIVYFYKDLKWHLRAVGDIKRMRKLYFWFIN